MHKPQKDRRESEQDDLNTFYQQTRNTKSTDIRWDGEDSTNRHNSITSNTFNTSSEHESFKWNKYDDRIKAMREAGVS